MVYRLLKSAAWICCVLVVISFALFARDQVDGASHKQVNQLVAGAALSAQPPGTGVPPPRHRTGQPRRFIDSAARTLTSPFSAIVTSHNVWVSRGIPTLVALAVYGLGLGYLARYSAVS